MIRRQRLNFILIKWTDHVTLQTKNSKLVIKVASFWFYDNFNLTKFRDAIFRYMMDLTKIIISDLLTYLLR